MKYSAWKNIMNIVIKKKKKKKTYLAQKKRSSVRGLEPTNVWSGVQRHNHSATFAVNFRVPNKKGTKTRWPRSQTVCSASSANGTSKQHLTFIYQIVK